MINKHAIKHIPNSQMAYPLNEDELFILLQTAKGDFQKVEMIFGDPHDYIPDDHGVYHWVIENKPHIQMINKYSDELFDYYQAIEFTKYKRAKYVFLLYHNDDIYFYSSKTIKKIDIIKDKNLIYDNLEYFCFPYMNKEDIINVIPWINNTIWYQIFPERFCNKKNTYQKYLPWGSVTNNINNSIFFGGNINGIISKIPYLKDLGINGIYFTPIFTSPSAHKYDTSDYYTIDPSFGTNDDFKNLVTKCHDNGIKVMLDAVFNHCGWNHPFFQDVVKNKEKSIYFDCFYIDNKDFINFDIVDGIPAYKGKIIPNYRTFAFTPFMPKLKTSHPIIEKYLLDVTRYWIEEYDIDGWRLDVSNEVSHSFWRKFRLLCNSLKKDFYILGENWEDSNPWLGNDQLNAVMNYEIAYPIWSFFDPNIDYSSKEFVYKINDLLIRYQINIQKNMFNLIGSHDTPRLLFRLDKNPNLVKLAYLFIFTFTGSPSIYYGDEIGLDGGKDPDNRRCMIWDENKQNFDLLSFFKKLIQIRKSNPDLHDFDFEWLYYQSNILIYRKVDTLIIINNNNNDITVNLPDKIMKITYLNLFNNSLITLKDEMILKPYEFYLLKPYR